jgi:hypothetical protein
MLFVLRRPTVRRSASGGSSTMRCLPSPSRKSRKAMPRRSASALSCSSEGRAVCGAIGESAIAAER